MLVRRGDVANVRRRRSKINQDKWPVHPKAYGNLTSRTETLIRIDHDAAGHILINSNYEDTCDAARVR